MLVVWGCELAWLVLVVLCACLFCKSPAQACLQYCVASFAGTNVSCSPPPCASQIHRQFRKPLIVFSPKNLLRHPKCKSALAEFDDVPDDQVRTFAKGWSGDGRCVLQTVPEMYKQQQSLAGWCLDT
jgi:hypothetical protein